MFDSFVDFRRIAIAMLLGLSVFLAACGGSGEGGTPPEQAMGTVALLLTDMPTDDLDEINLEVVEATLIGGEGQQTLFANADDPISINLLDLENFSRPIAFEDVPTAGSFMVFDQSRDMFQVARNFSNFFAHESCGKCYPCQMGTQRQSEILERIGRGGARPGDLDELLELGRVMTDTSICGLGQTASLAILNAYRNWPDLFSDLPGSLKLPGR